MDLGNLKTVAEIIFLVSSVASIVYFAGFKYRGEYFVTPMILTAILAALIFSLLWKLWWVLGMIFAIATFPLLPLLAVFPNVIWEDLVVDRRRARQEEEEDFEEFLNDLTEDTDRDDPVPDREPHKTLRTESTARARTPSAKGLDRSGEEAEEISSRFGKDPGPSDAKSQPKSFDSF